jgi:hypothetical protein
VQFLLKYVLTFLAPFIKYWSTPKPAVRVIAKALMNESNDRCIAQTHSLN